MNTLEQVKALIGGKAGIPAADVQDDAWLGRIIDKPGDPIKDVQYLALDSADRLELAMELEERFNIEISDEQADKPEMGTPAGLAKWIDGLSGTTKVGDGRPTQAPDYEPDGNIMRGVGQRWAEAGETPAETDAETFELTSMQPPIDREELMDRGLAEDLGGAVMDIVVKLGFPTEQAPMGTDATHMLVPITAEAVDKGASEVLSFRNWVKFLRIERAEPFPLIHFDHAAEDTPDWLIECISQAEGDEGAIYAREGVLFVRTAKGEEPVKPGQLIVREMVPQLHIVDDEALPEFLKD